MRALETTQLYAHLSPDALHATAAMTAVVQTKLDAEPDCGVVTDDPGTQSDHSESQEKKVAGDMRFERMPFGSGGKG